MAVIFCRVQDQGLDAVYGDNSLIISPLVLPPELPDRTGSYLAARTSKRVAGRQNVLFSIVHQQHNDCSIGAKASAPNSSPSLFVLTAGKEAIMLRPLATWKDQKIFAL